jgi:HEAT repeat protein/beta-lactamase regulating signal transducer with metallopeptidase domain
MQEKGVSDMEPTILSILKTSALPTSAAVLLFSITLKSVFVLFSVFLITKVARRASSSLRHLLWTSALVAILLLPLLGAVLPAWNLSLISLPSSQTPGSRLEKALDDSHAPASLDLFRNNRAERNTSSPALDPRTEQHIQKNDAGRPTLQTSIHNHPEAGIRPGFIKKTAVLLTLFWLLGISVFLAWLAAGRITIRRLSGRSTLISDPSWLRLSDELTAQMQIKRPVRLLKNRRVEMPMAWGLLHPRILLPAKADRWSREERRYALMHEFAHIKRMDSLTQLLAQLSVAVLWFNPFMWIGYRQLLKERERACDDIVLRDCPDSSAYAGMLLNVARSLTSARLLSQATVAMARKKQLEGRLLAILSPHIKRRALKPQSTLIVCAAALLMALPVAALRPMSLGGIPAETGKVEFSGRNMRSGLEAVSPVEPAQRIRDAEKNRMVVRSLAAALSDTDFEVRIAAAETLGRLESKEAVPPLMKALTDAAWEVRAAAAEALGNIRDKRAVGALISALGDEDWHVRLNAIEALGEISDQKAINPLAEALKDTNHSIRLAAVEALSNMEDRHALRPLCEALGDEDWRIRSDAAQALGELEDNGAVDPLISLLKDTNWEVRRNAAEALGDIAEFRSLSALTDALNDEAWQVRKEAAWALGEIEDSRAVTSLITALDDPHPEVKREAISSLSEIGDAAAVLPLCESLNDQDWEVRARAARALGELKDPRALEPLTASLKDRNEDVRQAAARALGKLRWRE